MTLRLLRAAVVGHTNTGKTSLMRSLLREVEFGEVSDRPGTTREVEAGTLFVDGQPAIELFDTPGLEDSISLLEELESYREVNGRRTDGFARLEHFLADEASRGVSGRFAQEAKALRRLSACDVALYVIDARDRVLGKHRDELEILACTARPVVPVLNFVASPSALTGTWREALARVNMHAIAEYDTVIVSAESELQLFEKMRSLLDEFRPTLDAVIEHRRGERRRRLLASGRLVGDLLVDAAGFVEMIEVDQREALARRLEEFKDRVRRREQRCVDELLELHRFRASDCAAQMLPIEDGRWGLDLFTPAALRKYGLRAGGAASAGALIGLGLDAAVGGLSLGAGAMLGATIGALAGVAKMTGKRVLSLARGRSELRVDESTLQLLAARQIELIAALFHRGHASQAPFHLGANFHVTENGRKALREVLSLARRATAYPEWSRLNEYAGGAAYRGGPGRDLLVKQLGDSIARALAGSVV